MVGGIERSTRATIDRIGSVANQQREDHGQARQSTGTQMARLGHGCDHGGSGDRHVRDHVAQLRHPIIHALGRPNSKSQSLVRRETQDEPDSLSPSPRTDRT